MNMPPPMQIKSYNEIQQNIASVYYDVADDLMHSASGELRNMANDKCGEKIEVVDIVVSCHGTLERRGFSSLNGVVTVIAIDTGKCVDCLVNSKQCTSCRSWESRKSTKSDLYEQFIAKLFCDINHEGFPGTIQISQPATQRCS